MSFISNLSLLVLPSGAEYVPAGADLLEISTVSIHTQVEKIIKSISDKSKNKPLSASAEKIVQKLLPIEDELIQFRAKVRRDLMHHPVIDWRYVNQLLN